MPTHPAHASDGTGTGGDGTGVEMLAELLRRERTTILRKWFTHVLETYPEDTTRFLKREKNPFANPVGSAIGEGLQGIFDELLAADPTPALVPFLDRIIRIRAVQEFSASTSLAFVFALKGIVRDVLKKEIRTHDVREDLAVLDARVDRLALLAFDTYVGCREELFELRVGELRRHRDAAVRVLERTNRFSKEVPQGENP